LLTHFLPRQVDNTYYGSRIALWLFGLLVLLRLIMSVNSIFNARDIASSADGIPLDTFPPAAAQTVVSLFANLGLATLIISLLCILVLVRYRALVPFMYALLLLHYLGRKLILEFMPIERTGTPPASVINLVLLTLMVVGLALSLWRRDRVHGMK
jgi:hypothetical protein